MMAQDALHTGRVFDSRYVRCAIPCYAMPKPYYGEFAMSYKQEQQLKEIASYVEILERGQRMDEKYLNGEYVSPDETLRYEGQMRMRANVIQSLKAILEIKD